MPYIQLTQGKRTQVDIKDFNQLNTYKWYAHYSLKKNRWVATRGKWDRTRKKLILLYMHREILELKYGDGKIVDHINMDTLDNRRKNLRCCSYSDNNCNRGNRKGGVSSYKGVSWHKRGQKWVAQIGKNGKRYYLGLFESEKDAALVYNKWALWLHKEFAYQNQV